MQLQIMSKGSGKKLKKHKERYGTNRNMLASYLSILCGAKGMVKV
jgi:hypothetical protein